MDQLDKYLQGLVKQAEAEARERARVDGLSFGELAHIAGIKLAESVCSECGGTMEKGGAMYKCSGCGMRKHAKVPESFKQNMEKVRAVQNSDEPGAEVPSNLGKASDQKKEAGVSSFLEKHPELGMRLLGGTIGTGAGAGLGALTAGSGNRLEGALTGGTIGGALGAAQPMILATSGLAAGNQLGRGLQRLTGLTAKQVRPAAEAAVFPGAAVPAAIAGGAGGLIPRALKKQQAKVQAAQDPGKPGAEKATGESLKKKESSVGDAAGRVLAKFAQDTEYPIEAKFVPGVNAATHALTRPEVAAQSLESLRSAGLRGMGYGAGIGAGAGALSGGLLGLLKSRGWREPLALGALGTGVGALSGAVIGPTITQERKLRELLNRAGIERTGALLPTHRFTEEAAEKYLPPEGVKTSAPIDLSKEELMEAIEAAKAREDITGRSQRWGTAGGIGGGALGGLSGGLGGYGLGRLIGSKVPALSTAAPIGGALLGATAGGLGGGLLGARTGREEGAEEAAADLLVSRLRQGAAGQRGAMAGYLAGLRRGVDMGVPPMAQEKGASARPFRKGR